MGGGDGGFYAALRVGDFRPFRSNIPREGGVYAWTRMAFGDFHGFICGWCYWVNTFLYVPSVFLSIVAVASLVGGESTAWLDRNPVMVTLIASSALWLSAALHIFGLGQGKWLQNFGAFGRLGMAVAILCAAVWKLAHPEVAPAAAQPALGVLPSLALWPFVLNALVGLDLGSAMSDEADAPERSIPRSLLTGGSAVAACYLLTFGALVFIGVNDPNPIYGHIQAVSSVFSQFGVLWLASLVALIELLGLAGCGAAWVAAPARIPFVIGIDQYLPKAFARVHPRFGTPYVALIVQASIATALIFVNIWGATLKDAYLALLGGSIVLVMVTYVYLLAAWWRLGGAKTRVVLLSLTGLAAISVSLLAGFLPPPTVENVWKFELNLIGSVVVMLICGLAVYGFGRRRFKIGASAGKQS